MKFLLPLLGVALLLNAAALAANPQANIIPRPVSMTVAEGSFPLTSKIPIVAAPLQRPTAEHLRDQLTQRLGAAPQILPASDSPSITLTLDPSANSNPEGYKLLITPQSIRISAPADAGLFYGLQTLLQIVDTQIAATGTQAAYTLPALTIDDQPRYLWRGFMLDEARHFFGKPTVLKLLDTMAYLKLNRFQWHLTDDRWRLEIKQYPKLTDIGAKGNSSDPDVPPAAYTQDDIRQIVRYAADRHIVIIPEIEMPGHARGATVAYPDLAGGDKADPKWQLFTFNPASPLVRTFLQNVIDETVQLFPGPYLNIGGDETHFGNKAWSRRPEVQEMMKKENLPNLAAVEHLFMQQMARYVVSKGKKVAGWEEVAKTGLPVNQVSPIWWHDEDQKGLSEKIARGYEVIVCPHHPMYFDFIQYKGHKSGRLHLLNSIQAVYDYPEPLRKNAPNIDQAAGLQAAAWSEWLNTSPRLWFMTCPRLSALAEAAWTPASRKDYADFTRRLPTHLHYLKQHEINYFSPLDPSSTPEVVGPASLRTPEWEQLAKPDDAKKKKK